MPDPQCAHAGIEIILDVEPAGTKIPIAAVDRHKRSTKSPGVNSMRLILIILLVLLLVGSFPVWPYSAGWGYYPTGGLSLLVIIVVVILFAR